MNRVQIRVVFDRKKVASSKKKGLVQLEVTFESQRKFISTGIKLFKNQFKTGRVVNTDEADRLNEDINLQINQINGLVSLLNKNKKKFSLDYLDHANDMYNTESFLDFMERRIEERPICAGTQMQHRKILRFLRNEYTQLTYFSDLTYPNIPRFDEYLKKKESKRTFDDADNRTYLS